MNKIIVRKDILGASYRCVGSSYINLTGGVKFRTIKNLLENFKFNFLMKSLFDEEFDNEDLSKSSLYQSYSELIKEKEEGDRRCKKNEKFVEMYKINEEFALSIDNNIYLYNLISKKEVYTKLVPWYYSDSKMYFGDCWGEVDEEIVQNIQKLSVIQFLQRYKGYIGYWN